METLQVMLERSNAALAESMAQQTPELKSLSVEKLLLNLLSLKLGGETTSPSVLKVTSPPSRHQDPDYLIALSAELDSAQTFIAELSAEMGSDNVGAAT